MISPFYKKIERYNMNFKRDFIDLFGNDYKHIGKYKIKPFSFIWWIILIGQGLIGAIGFYVFCVLILLALG